MTGRARGRLRVAAVGAILVAGAWATVDVVNLAIYLPWAIVGAALAIRRPANPIGPLLLGFAWLWMLTSDPVGLDLEALQAGRYDWSVGLRLILSDAIGFAGYAVLILIVVLFPDGDLPRGRGRSVILTIAGAGIALSVFSLFMPQMSYDFALDGSVRVPNPVAVPAIGAPMARIVDDGWPFLVLIATLVGAVASLIIRWRRATGLRRRQFTWVVAAFTSLAVTLTGAFAAYALGDALGYTVTELVWLPALLCYALPPLAIGVAVLRYRLYEIDRLVSRTIGYGIATAGLVGSFAALTLVLQQLLAPIIQGRVLAVAASTLVVFALFQPIHRRIQRVVDRRFDRARYDADLAASAFARRVRDETDLRRVEDRLVEAVDHTLAPTSRSLWVRDRRQSTGGASFPDASTAGTP